MREQRRFLGWLAYAGFGMALAACGGSNGGGAGGPPSPGAVGDPCETGTCANGYICEPSGVFNGQCSVGCNSDQACSLLDPRGRCFGMTNPLCGQPCIIDAECPTATRCVTVVAGSSQKACQAIP